MKIKVIILIFISIIAVFSCDDNEIYSSIEFDDELTLHGDFEFRAQAEIDSFKIIYSNYSKIDGEVSIGGYDITNLNGLSNITAISASLTISYCSLTNLLGLDNLAFIGEHLSIGADSIINSLNGLEGLKTIGVGFAITECSALTSLNGLENLNNITNGGIVISFCPSLTSLIGINNIKPEGVKYLGIALNESLSDCDIQSVCNLLNKSNIEIEIDANAPGCDNPTEVEEECKNSKHYTHNL